MGVALRGASPVGDDDRDRAGGVSRSGLPGRQPGLRQLRRPPGVPIEYDTTGEGNHAHTVLRRPRSDFGDDILAAHYTQAHA
jgi:hypothetical protein